MFPFGGKPNHAAIFDEPFRVADGEDVPALQIPEDFFHLTCLGTADEQNLASLDFLNAVETLDDQRMAVHFFTLHRIVQESVKGILAQNADPEGLILMGEGGRRPLDEFGEMEKESGL